MQLQSLSDLANIAAGHPFRGKVPESPGSGVIAVQMKDASPQQGVSWAECVETEPAGRRDDWLQVGDILVAARGSHNYAVLIDDTLTTMGKLAVAAPHFFVVRVTHHGILPEYLCWFLNQQPSQRYFDLNSEGTLTKAIKRSALEATPIAIPPLNKQQIIIKLANTIKQELQLIEQLRRNGEQLLTSIANGLLK
ncbi:restriction endonuclease subunit S [Iodobacter ciconiae]|uniref:Restriction endonuclease subunit S n=1 Tax=Iodobacter ciconiae TaxID=2496266 RepID=A0A3S8ZTI2_9NEIS|nr:restriction endonuclease subunit S [Iodobacter ciconiae]AZN36731.1 restriction endonuclease subunit S [Iodobacter ciconiae]